MYIRNETHLSQLCIIQYDAKRIGELNYILNEDYAEIGIKIWDTSYQNNGYGKSLLKMLINFLFTDKKINNALSLKKIKLDTNLNNKRAQHVYEEIGFKKVATNIDAWKDQLGNLQSSIDYELSRDDYKKLYGKK